MAVRHVLSILQMDTEIVSGLINRSLAYGSGNLVRKKPLKNKVVGIYFRCASTRTRTAFTAGAMRLGANIIAYGPNDLQIVTGETIQDTTTVLSGFLDALVIRTNDSIEEMKALASQDRMAIVNAMSEDEHPTQSIADLATIKEEFGRLNDLHILYVGEGNNTASALAFAVALSPGMQLTLATPEGYGLCERMISEANRVAKPNGSFIHQQHDISRLPSRVDVVYTTRWQTMGVPKSDANWRERFEPFKVTADLMARVSKPGGTIFLHDLPAVRGGDVDDEILDGPQSRAFRQAWHKMTSAMAILEWCLAA